MKSYWLILWSLWAARLVRQPTLPVRISGGLVRGSLAADGSYVSYLGLPYASYQNRFQPSQPSAEWNGVFQATEEHVRCSQRFSTTWINGQEDCLTLNVYTPIPYVTTEKLLPVMVFIHGGGYRDGLFHRAIMQSGSAISPWSLQFEPFKTASYLAHQIGYKLEDPTEILKLLSKISVKELLSTRIPRAKGDVILSENIFVPCIEKNNLDEEKFLTDSPYNLISKGQFNKVPIIMGYNNAEGYMFIGKENKTTLETFNFYDALPRDLEFPLASEKHVVAKKMENQYYKRKDFGNDKLIRVAKYEGDSGIGYPVTATIELLSASMEYPVYAYKFCYDGWMNLIKMLFRLWKYPGATHADDLFYIFKVKATLPQSFIEKNIIDRMALMWTNFAKYGNPTPGTQEQLPKKWYSINRKNPQLYVIDKEFSSAGLWDDEDLRLWNETYSKYRRRK
ncbi:antennal esterase CXE20 [Danaus plexippus plexippus]|uniref:Antennal esterase CXE20 n=1 Tax=Danaus plexippus plexippus TaxID=278856 RepID=A0A212EK06_DANPL|nr:antennal esterase CXE20 [Danaus plexippus plexippus]